MLLINKKNRFKIKGGYPPYIYQWVSPSGFRYQPNYDGNIEVYESGLYKLTLIDNRGNTTMENFYINVVSNHKFTHINLVDGNEFIINHNINSEDILVQCYNVYTSEKIEVDIEILDHNNIKITSEKIFLANKLKTIIIY